LHHSFPPLDLFSQRLDLALELVGERQPLCHEVTSLSLVCSPETLELGLEVTRSPPKRVELVAFGSGVLRHEGIVGDAQRRAGRLDEST
jgi:hypothetical protein